MRTVAPAWARNCSRVGLGCAVEGQSNCLAVKVLPGQRRHHSRRGRCLGDQGLGQADLLEGPYRLGPARHEPRPPGSGDDRVAQPFLAGHVQQPTPCLAGHEDEVVQLAGAGPQPVHDGGPICASEDADQGQRRAVAPSFSSIRANSSSCRPSASATVRPSSGRVMIVAPWLPLRFVGEDWGLWYGYVGGLGRNLYFQHIRHGFLAGGSKSAAATQPRARPSLDSGSGTARDLSHENEHAAAQETSRL